MQFSVLLLLGVLSGVPCARLCMPVGAAHSAFAELQEDNVISCPPCGQEPPYSSQEKAILGEGATLFTEYIHERYGFQEGASGDAREQDARPSLMEKAVTIPIEFLISIGHSLGNQVRGEKVHKG